MLLYNLIDQYYPANWGLKYADCISCREVKKTKTGVLSMAPVFIW